MIRNVAVTKSSRELAMTIIAPWHVHVLYFTLLLVGMAVAKHVVVPIVESKI